MSNFRLNTRSLEPVHALSEDRIFRLPRDPPSDLIKAWYRSPTVTAFERVDSGSTVQVRVCNREPYEGNSRSEWQEAFVHIDDHDTQLGAVPQPGACRLVNRGRETLAKIDNWMSTVPLPLVLLKFDAIVDVAARGPVNSHQFLLLQFALLLIDLGLIEGVRGDEDEQAQGMAMIAVVPWLEQHFPAAVALWVWTYTHVYHNARTVALTHGVPWATQLHELPIDFGRGRWHAYLEHVARGGPSNTLYPTQGEFFSRGVHRTLCPCPVFTDFYLALHPERRQLLNNGSRANAMPRPPARDPPEQFKPNQRGPFRHIVSSIFRLRKK